jgi:hypothetical protein
MMALKGKDDYLALIYPMQYAAGGVFWEKLTEPRPRLGWLRVALPAVVFVPGLAAVPLVLPVLPPARIVPYMEGLGIKPIQTETHMRGLLPQYFADEFDGPRWSRPWPAFITRFRRRAFQNCNPRAQLRRSGRNRLLRPALRIAQVDQPSSELLLLGTETIHRRKPHPPRVGSRRCSALVWQCGSGANRRSVLRHGVGALCHPDLP